MVYRVFCNGIDTGEVVEAVSEVAALDLLEDYPTTRELGNIGRFGTSRTIELRWTVSEAT